MKHLMRCLLLLALLTLTVRAEELPPMEAVPLEEQPAETQIMYSPQAPVLPDHYFDVQGKKIIRWNDQTRNIMVYIPSGYGMPGWQDVHIQAVKAAFWEWEQAMAPRFHFIYMFDERGSDIIVKWRARSDAGDEMEKAGENKTVTWGKYIAENNIEIMLNNHHGEPNPPAQIQSIALHEIGHALGIKGHSDHDGDIMTARQTRYVTDTPLHLSARDVNTMKMIYQHKPDYTNPEGYHLSNFSAFQKTQGGKGMRIMWVVVGGFIPVPIPLPF